MIISFGGDCEIDVERREPRVRSTTDSYRTAGIRLLVNLVQNRDRVVSKDDLIAAYSRSIGRDYHEATRLARQAIRQRSDFVGAHRVLTLLPQCPVRSVLANLLCRRCGVRSPIFLLAGWRTICPSNTTPSVRLCGSIPLRRV
jgi:hypothetical protein